MVLRVIEFGAGGLGLALWIYLTFHVAGFRGQLLGWIAFVPLAVIASLARNERLHRRGVRALPTGIAPRRMQLIVLAGGTLLVVVNLAMLALFPENH